PRPTPPACAARDLVLGNEARRADSARALRLGDGTARRGTRARARDKAAAYARPAPAPRRREEMSAASSSSALRARERDGREDAARETAARETAARGEAMPQGEGARSARSFVSACAARTSLRAPRTARPSC